MPFPASVAHLAVQRRPVAPTSANLTNESVVELFRRELGRSTPLEHVDVRLAKLMPNQNGVLALSAFAELLVVHLHVLAPIEIEIT